MGKVFVLLMVGLVFSGCTTATWELIYMDARVVYKDAKYVVHEVQESKKQTSVGYPLKMMPSGLNVDIDFRG